MKRFFVILSLFLFSLLLLPSHTEISRSGSMWVIDNDVYIGGILGACPCEFLWEDANYKLYIVYPNGTTLYETHVYGSYTRMDEALEDFQDCDPTGCLSID